MDSVIMEVLIDSGLLKYYTHTVFKYQSFNIIVYLKGNKVIIKGTSSISRRKLFTYLWTSRRFPIAAKTALFLQSKYTLCESREYRKSKASRKFRVVCFFPCNGSIVDLTPILLCRWAHVYPFPFSACWANTRKRRASSSFPIEAYIRLIF